jgi:hypothetical protein
MINFCKNSTSIGLKTPFFRRKHFKIITRVITGVDVMITIFGEFRQLLAKRMVFFSKTKVMIKLLNNLALF